MTSSDSRLPGAADSTRTAEYRTRNFEPQKLGLVRWSANTEELTGAHFCGSGIDCSIFCGSSHSVLLVAGYAL
jgi:hypothetical protein